MAHEMCGPFWRNHENIDVFRRGNEPEMNSEAVRESQILARFHGGRDFAFVNSRREFVGGENHDKLALFPRLPPQQHSEPPPFYLCDGFTPALLSHPNLAPPIPPLHC